MSYVPTENGTKVNKIKEKFERSNFTENKKIDNGVKEGDEEVEEEEEAEEEGDPKELLRRSLSSSPVKQKKSLKLNVTRQLSNPGINIKRTPAFRGDKLTRIKNLHSPSKEKVISIVDQNVKMFEEQPEYGKIGNVKKKKEILNPEKMKIDMTDYFKKKKIIEKNKNWRSPLPPPPLLTKDKTVISENTVKTTVISRQKNISPMYSHSFDDFVPTIISITKDNEPEDTTNDEKLGKFSINGVEYTRVLKEKSCSENDKCAKLSEDFSLVCKNDYDDEATDIRKDILTRPIENDETPRLTDSLKAALKAPLPVGPPPKKPPRTFAHSPVTRRYRLNDEEKNTKTTWFTTDECHTNIGIDLPDFATNPKDQHRINQPVGYDNNDNGDGNYHHNGNTDNIKPKILSSIETAESPIKDNKLRNCLANSYSMNSFQSDNSAEQSSTMSSSSSKHRSARDAKKMLEKIESVLIQHQNAVGSKVIMPRMEKNQIEISYESRKKSQSSSDKDLEMRDKKTFHNRLLHALEKDSNKSRLLNKNQDSNTRKHSTFDCLPSLNCASSTVYKQPDFRNYLTESVKSKSQDSLDISISNLVTNKNDYFDDMMDPATNRLSTELTTFTDGKRRQSGSTNSEERVYAEPFSFDKNSGTDITRLNELSPEEHNYLSRSWRSQKNKDQSTENNSLGKKDKELHYLCTPIDPTVIEFNNNGPEDSRKLSSDSVSFQHFLEKTSPLNRPSPLDGPNKEKVERLLNQAFGPFVMAGTETSSDSNPSSDTDSLASTLSIAEEASSFNEKLRLFENRDSYPKPSKEELQRSLTEKRKHYVRRVSIKYSENREVNFRERRDRLFDICLLVELNLSTKKPYIKDKYPAYANAPAWIENFCFPDAQIWPSSDSNSNQFYSLFLMDEKGNRRYGYCCRVKPEGGPILPLAYCLITKYRASGFYHKVLLELESKHGLADKRKRHFIEELYNSPMPKPGCSLKLTIKGNCRISGDDNSSNNNDALINQNCQSNEILDDSLTDLDTSESVIMRLGDPRLEERDMSQLFDAVTNKVLIYLFSCLLLERRVVLTSNNLGKLSCCIEALQSLLYPFVWPHTFIPVLPDIPGLSTILQAPLPFVIGILKSKNSLNPEIALVQDGIVVDIDTSKIICAVGDESSILPSRLQKDIRSALHLITNNTRPGDGLRNVSVSETFLRVFVETCAHLEGHLVTQQDGKVIFQKESFVKATSSKSIQYFLEWFVETTMFNAFVNDYIAWVEGTTIEENRDIKFFSEKVAEYRNSADKNSQLMRNAKKKMKKTFGDRLKDLTNFYT